VNKGKDEGRSYSYYGPDAEFIDRALEQTFDRLAVDAKKLAVEGFSDGASYTLSIGLTNGDLFTHVLAFSPGFAAPAGREGTPRIFVSHGVNDNVLPLSLSEARLLGAQQEMLKCSAVGTAYYV
jgi:phospholipase/carboxylesterase